MESMVNYLCEFSKGDKVRVRTGFLKGEVGKVVSVSISNDIVIYKVKTGLFKSILVTEYALELLD